MPNELRTKLDELTRQLDQSDDPALNEKLKPLIAQVQQQLHDAGEDDENSSLSDVFNEIVTELEVEHPTVTKLLADIAVKLSSMGI